MGTFLPGFVPGKFISFVLGPFQSGFVFRAGSSRQRQRQEHAGADRGMPEQADAEAEAGRSNRSQSAPARASGANRCKYMSGRRCAWF